MAGLHAQKHVFGVVLVAQKRNRKSLPVLFGLFLRPTCMPNMKRRVANFSCFEDHNGDVARKKHVFGVLLATRERNRKSQPALVAFFAMNPHPEFGAPGPKSRPSKTIL